MGKDDVLSLGECQITPTGLSLPEDLRFEEWELIGQQLRQIEGTIQFCIGDWLNYGSDKYERGRYERAVEKLGFEKPTLKVYASVAANVKSLIRINDLDFGHHQIVAPLSEDQQRYWLERAAEGEDGRRWSVSKLRQEIKRSVPSPPLPEGRYRVLYADPPWDYSNTGFKQSAAGQYPTIPTEELCEFTDGSGRSIRDLAAGDSVLFLWATSPMLRDAMRVMEAWGFEYKVNMVWIKDRAPGMGWFLETRHELLLIGTKGTLHPRVKHVSVIKAPIGKHSQKPEEFYEIIEQMYGGEGEWCELFARNKRKGWESWGEEVRLPA